MLRARFHPPPVSRLLTPAGASVPPLLPAVIKPVTVFSIAPFRFDVTPPLNHALLGGLIGPAIALDDPLEAIGYVLLGSDAPIVVCALDWAGLLNDAHVAWRNALAEAAETTPDRVAVQCVHQHNAPFVCPGAHAAIAANADLPSMFDVGFFDQCLARARRAVRKALLRPQPITHVAHGQAVVRNVASNRRIARDAAGQVIAMRESSCRDPQLRALPEGTIDPTLQTIAFLRNGVKILSCHYYATHPMSYYRDGRVSSDFCGLARKRRQRDDPGCTHVYFTGCAGNVAAGKYNDGTPAARWRLESRIYRAIASSEASLVPQALASVEWRCENVLPRPHPAPRVDALEAAIVDRKAAPLDRLLPAFRLGWLQRVERRVPIVLSCLRLNDISALHLPGEMFVEYQLRARAMRPDHPVAVAAYGDDGLWYVPTKEEYAAGGYEVLHAFCTDEIDGTITTAMRRLLE